MMMISVSNAATNTVIHIDATKPLHEANPMYMGCHSDSGFVHEVTGFQIFHTLFLSNTDTSSRLEISDAFRRILRDTSEYNGAWPIIKFLAEQHRSVTQEQGTQPIHTPTQRDPEMALFCIFIEKN